MGKLYTVDQKLLTDTPEVRIGDKVYPVDNRTKTVHKFTQLGEAQGKDPEAYELEVLGLLLGKQAAKEIQTADYPYPAYIKIFETVIAAATGEEPEVISERFQEPKTA